MRSGTVRLLAIVAVFMLLLAACAPPVEPTPVPRLGELQPPAEAPTPEEGPLIDEVLLLTEGDPPSAYAVEIHGHLRDGCTFLDVITQTVEGDRILVTVTTTRDPEAICIMALQPFSVTMPLDVQRLAPGRYVVDVHGVTVDLELTDLPREGDVVYSQDAIVEAVHVLPVDRLPSPYVLEIQGHLRDGCSSLGRVEQTVDGNRIVITLTTVRPKDALCTMALVPFAHTVPLEVADLEPGEYVVEVHGVSTTVTLSSADLVAPPLSELDAMRRGLVEIREAAIESVDVQILESFPVQIRVVIEGYFPDGCTQLAGSSQLVQGDSVQIRLYTQRAKDAMCTMAIVPYREVVSLDTRTLRPGVYTIDVNGITQELVLDEGMLTPAEEPLCPAPGEGQLSLVNVGDGYCLLYPATHRARSLAPGVVAITAQERADLSEARGVSLVIERMGATEGREPEQLAEDQWGTLARQYPELAWRQEQLGALQGMVVEGIPGRLAGRQALVSDGETWYLLTLTPVDPAQPRQTAYAEVLWENVLTSWRFRR